MIAKAAGIDPKGLKIVVYSSGGQGTTAALGGHVDVWAGTLGGALPHAQSGTVRVLGVSAEQRQPGRAVALPTFREQGMTLRPCAVARLHRARRADGGATGFLGRDLRAHRPARRLEEIAGTERMGRRFSCQRGNPQAPRRRARSAAQDPGGPRSHRFHPVMGPAAPRVTSASRASNSHYTAALAALAASHGVGVHAEHD